MSQSNPAVIAQFVRKYRGSEEFYFLNQKGELGYITGAIPHLVKETIAERKDERFLARYPDFEQEVSAFQQFLIDLCESCPSTPELELGYVVPLDDSRSWQTATLVMHEHIVSVMQETVKHSVKERNIKLDDADRKINALTLERGIYHGLDDLFNHVSTFGHQPFFPVFYYARESSEPGPEQTSPLRVLNLRYMKPDCATPSHTNNFESVYSLLRSKLMARGALNPSQRVERRFTLEGE